jgi:hypothetical protein
VEILLPQIDYQPATPYLFTILSYNLPALGFRHALNVGGNKGRMNHSENGNSV